MLSPSRCCKKANISISNPNRGGTALHFAALAGEDEIIKALLNTGAYIDAQNDHKQTPLMLANSANLMRTVEILLSHGASIEIMDWDGKNVIDHCTASKLFDRVRTYKVILARRLAQPLTSYPNAFDSRSSAVPSLLNSCC